MSEHYCTLHNCEGSQSILTFKLEKHSHHVMGVGEMVSSGKAESQVTLASRIGPDIR